MPNKSAVEKIPHSWSVEDWPQIVYPRSSSKGRYILRANRDALVAAGALVRVGRDLVVIGPAYEKWLVKQGGRVAEFEIAPNAAPVPRNGEPRECTTTRGVLDQIYTVINNHESTGRAAQGATDLCGT